METLLRPGPSGSPGLQAQRYPNPCYPAPVTAEATNGGDPLPMATRKAASQPRLLREIFNGGRPPADLPKSTLVLDKDALDEEVDETSVATIHYFQTIAKLPEAGIGTEHCTVETKPRFVTIIRF